MRIDIPRMALPATTPAATVPTFTLISDCRRPDEHPAGVYLARLKPSGRRGMRQVLGKALEMLFGRPVDPIAFEGWHQIRYPHVSALRVAMESSGAARATTNKMLAAIRGVAKEAWRLGSMDRETLAKIQDVGGVKGSDLPAGRALSDAEVLAMRKACADGSPIGARDVALLAGLFIGSLRRSELVALNVEDWDSTTGALRVIGGKGGKSRVVYLLNGGREALDRWLEVRRAELGTDDGPLFVSARHGALEPSRLTDDGVFEFVKRAAARAGVAPWSPHDARRTSLTNMLRAGIDLFLVQRHAGHSSPTTTARYDRRDERSQADAARKMHFPFRSDVCLD